MPNPWHMIINVCVQMIGDVLQCFEVYIYMVMGTGLWGLAELTVIANLDYEYGSVSRPQMNLGYHQPN